MSQEQFLATARPVLIREIELTISPKQNGGPTCSEIAMEIAGRLLGVQPKTTGLICSSCQGAIACFALPGDRFSDRRFPVHNSHICRGCGAVVGYRLEIVTVDSGEKKPVFACYLCGRQVNL